jgi:hypothetical protein
VTDSPRERAARGVAKLKKYGEHDEAAAIEAFLAPRGWVSLRDTDPSMTVEKSPLSLTMTRALKESLKAAAAELNWSLETLVEEGFRAVLDSGWLPPKTLRTHARGALQKAQRELKAQTKTVLQLQVDNHLRQQVEQMTPELTDRAGYRVTLSSIAISWMADELGVDRPSGEDRDVLRLVVRRSFAEHVAAAAAKRGMTLDQVMGDGLRSLLDGSWTPQLAGWNVVEDRPRGERSQWQSSSDKPVETTKLTLHVEQGLLEGLRMRAAEMNEESTVPVYPGTIAIACLKDRLGEPAE